MRAGAYISQCYVIKLFNGDRPTVILSTIDDDTIAGNV